MITAPSPIIEHLASKFKGEVISYRDFIEQALYTPEIGYYTRNTERVGRSRNTDFYTAESLGSLFSELIIAAVRSLMVGKDLSEYTFVEIGAEPNQGLFKDIIHPFADYKIIRSQDACDIPSKTIVFSNELLDAQPFNRLIYKSNQWHERGVRLNEDMKLTEELLSEPTPEVQAFIKTLPESHQEGYQLDMPLDAEVLFEEITTPQWEGLLLFFDYGLTWEELLYTRPQGTARAYYRHELSADLLANPGEQDITCHICWDRLQPILTKHNFDFKALQRQEAFFVHNCAYYIQQLITERAEAFDPRRQTLMELLHPSHMGSKFQVLSATRF